jgi:hypothetical protein
MNTKNLIIASVIGGLVTAFLAYVPIISLLNCVLCLPFWAGPILGTWYYKRETGTMPMNHALTVGAVSGVIAGVIGLIVSILFTDTAALAQQLNQILPEGSLPPELAAGGASVLSGLLGIVFAIIFGAIGGAIGGAIFKDKPTTPMTPPMA